MPWIGACMDFEVHWKVRTAGQVRWRGKWPLFLSKRAVFDGVISRCPGDETYIAGKPRHQLTCRSYHYISAISSVTPEHMLISFFSFFSDLFDLCTCSTLAVAEANEVWSGNSRTRKLQFSGIIRLQSLPFNLQPSKRIGSIFYSNF